MEPLFWLRFGEKLALLCREQQCGLAAQLVEQFQIGGRHLNGCSFANEVQSQQNCGASVATFNPAFDAAEGTGFDEDSAALANQRRHSDFRLGFQRPEDVD